MPSSYYRLHNILGINGYVQEVIDCMEGEVEEQKIGTYSSFHCIIELDELRFYAVTVNTDGEVLVCSALTD